jgi:hypothetical protein
MSGKLLPVQLRQQTKMQLLTNQPDKALVRSLRPRP